MTFSTDLDAYVPMCRPCHRRYDAERAAERRATAHLAIAPLGKRRPPRRTYVVALDREPLFGGDDANGWTL
ncbi:hypothetical protein [Microbacterium sp. No. 7]|uniref:hypothetical protein n=1 Tax=Microbacterium sp. No. 7 TaxID=1714373 RepID=UPI0006CF4D44|nr:hypothetical protein [Microbacterium sp. No. 7]